MTKWLLGGASILALALVLPGQASANPKCSFATCQIFVDSEVFARDIAGDRSGNSESFNTVNEAVSNQTLSAFISGNQIIAFGGIGFAGTGGFGGANSGGVDVSGVTGTAGITTVSANTGQLSIIQQANSLAAVGNVTFGGAAGGATEGGGL
jgi:hypothetical protein